MLLRTLEVVEERGALFAGDVGGCGGAGGDALCATYYLTLWRVGSVSRFRDFRCGSFLFTVLYPDSEWTAYSLLNTALQAAEDRSHSAVGSCKVDSNKCVRTCLATGWCFAVTNSNRGTCEFKCMHGENTEAHCKC